MEGKQRSKLCPGCRRPWDFYPCTRQQCGKPLEAYQAEARHREGLIRMEAEAENNARITRGAALKAHFQALEAHTFKREKTAIKWLLEFAFLNLDTLNDEERRRQRYCIATFSQLGVLQNSPMSVFGWVPRAGSFRTTTYAWNRHQAVLVANMTPGQEIEQRRLPSPETVKILQRLLQRQLEQFKTFGRISAPQPRGKLTLFFDKRQKQVTEYFVPRRSERDTPENLFLYRCARVLPWDRLRCCPNDGCGKWFIAGRDDQRCCGNACRARSYNRRERGTPRERFGKLGRPAKIESASYNEA
jgi:hypothetical protein